MSFGVWSNDQPLLPFTINSALPQFTLPRTTAEAEAHVFSTNLNLVSRPATDWRFSARLRHYGYDNQTPPTAIPQYINYDTSVETSSTGGPELYAHSRTTFDADATWSGLHPVALTVGYTHNNNGYDFRIFRRPARTLRLAADAVGSSWMTFRAYETASRTGSGLERGFAAEIGEQPEMRHYDFANRHAKSLHRPGRRHAERALDVQCIAAESARTTSTTATSACRSRRSATISLGPIPQPNGFGAGGTYNYERYAGLQRSHDG